MSAPNSKRHRTPSLNSTSSTSTLHPSKASRIVPEKPGSADNIVTSHPLLCTLPPTCNHRSTPLANSRDMEIHYATYHAHVCEQGGCGAVFPEARLLELHQTECHDPLAAVRKERGDKIFACLLVSCPKFFSTPKKRRLHLIQAHGYPKEFFFAVTNKGIGGLLKRWGEGASMIRGEWKPREPKEDEELEADDDDEDEDEDVDQEEGENQAKNVEAESQVDEGMNIDANKRNIEGSKGSEAKSMSVDEALEALANNMDSLSLVPSSIRFGRGGKKGGFLQSSGRGLHMFDARGINDIGHRGRGRGGRGRGRGSYERATIDVDLDGQSFPPVAQPAFGRPRRGRASIDHPRSRGGSR